ncbi:NAD-P-binding protein [Mycena olivaceomarginata]|nr:NAD-P-binding protein [Mycena olivaceomarginata]
MSEKRTVLITGCTDGGIGSALAKEFHSRGFRVFATSRRLETMKQLSKIGIETLALDVTQSDDIRRTKENISTRTGGKLDILINNAHIVISESHAVAVHEAAVSDVDMSDVRGLFETNVFAAICMVQEFLPLLIASGKGCVVNNGSIMGVLPVPLTSTYNSTKAALHSFGNTLRVELAPFNVRVVNLITGSVQSNILKPYTFPHNSLYSSMQEEHRARYNEIEKGSMPTAEYARTVVAELTKTNPRGSLWAGSNANLSWFVETFLPRRIMDWIVADMYGISKLAVRLKRKSPA